MKKLSQTKTINHLWGADFLYLDEINVIHFNAPGTGSSIHGIWNLILLPPSLLFMFALCIFGPIEKILMNLPFVPCILCLDSSMIHETNMKNRPFWEESKMNFWLRLKYSFILPYIEIRFKVPRTLSEDFFVIKSEFFNSDLESTLPFVTFTSEIDKKNDILFVSHKWDGDDPDPKESLLDHIKSQLLETGCKYVWLDFLCTTQGGRCFENVASVMKRIPEMTFSMHYPISEAQSFWCNFEKVKSGDLKQMPPIRLAVRPEDYASAHKLIKSLSDETRASCSLLFNRNKLLELLF